MGLIIGVTALNVPLYAASGTEGASFLDIPVGARPAALGSAYSALSSDAYASVWNPAGLGFVQQSEVAAQHLSYLESTHYEYLGLAQPINAHSAFGASVQYLGSGDIAGTDNFGNSIGNYSSYFAAYSAAYSYRFGEIFSIGSTARWINAGIDGFSANAYAADVGALFRPAEAWSFGATVANIGSKLTFLDTGDSLPLAGHLSAAYQPTIHWTLAAEVVQEESGFTSGRGGIEWRPIPMLALRAGYRSDTVQQLSPIAGMSAGIGISLWGSEFSYAWLPLGDLGSGQYFSLVIRFGRETEKRRNLIYYQSIQGHAQRAGDGPSDADLEEIIQLIAAPNEEPVAQR